MTNDRTSHAPVAIIGMGCRYPGAPDVVAFWRVLLDGIDAITDVPRERWDADALYDPDPAARGRITSRKGGFIDGLELFDAAFFGISPREAPHVDPRQRLVLESAWEALEGACIPPDALAGSRTGVFIATLSNDYDQLLFADLRRVDAWSGAGTANSVVANRISYVLDLRGPSVALDTACSGSLVAIHLACESLRRGESTLAIAGGVSVNLMPRGNVFFSRAGALSPNGACRTFDRDADGIVRSDGCGIVVLKPLARAIADGDPVIAVIAGSAINHDGRSNGIMAPNGEAQRAVLADAYRNAGIAPDEVQHVEAHGTGTRLGDPIEVQALGSVLGGGPCVLGSLKTNFGHTESAAGVAGVIKTALALQHRVLPPTLHFREPNPLIPFDHLPFEVRTTSGPWPREGAPLVAGVSAFGFGGTNVHVVMREAPPLPKAAALPPPSTYLLPLSARTPAALRELTHTFATALADESLDPGDACFTAANGRMHHEVRIAVAGESREELVRALASAAPRGETAAPPRIAFVFSGQGSHWEEMGKRLHASEPVFRAVYDRIAPPAGPLEDTEIAQRSIFAVQAALGALWRSWGIEPDVVAGHSLGEIAAAQFAGVLELEDAARIVAHRSRLMKRAAGKGRTCVAALSLDEARAFERAGVAVAGTNSPAMTVLSGTPEAIDALVRELEARGTFCRALPGIDIALHSPQMQPLARELTERLEGLRPGRAAIPLLSTVTGAEVDGPELDARYWGRNLREPFLFTTVTEELLRRGVTTIVEVSPHPVLASAVAQTAAQMKTNVTVLPSLRRGEHEMTAMLRTLGALYAEGCAVRWSEVARAGRRVALPGYPFQRQPYWLNQIEAGAVTETVRIADGQPHPLLGPPLEAAGAAGTCYWECQLHAGPPHWLGDHRVWGEPVLPGAAWLDMALTAARHLDPSASIADVAFESQLRLREPRKMQVAAVDGLLTLYSRGANEASWSRHATARLELGHNASAFLSGGDAAALEMADMRAVDEAMEENGIVYGPSFRLIEDVRIGRGESVAKIVLPEALADRRHAIHPALLDCAFRAIAPALPAGAARLPVGVGAFQVFREVPPRVTCHATVVESVGEDLRVDATLVDDSEQVVARVRGLTLRRTAASRPLLHSALLAQQWEELPPTASRQAPTGKTITCSGASVDDALAAAQEALRENARLVFVTQNAQPVLPDDAIDVRAAAIWGLGAAIAVEQPALACRCIDVDESATQEDIEREIRLGGDEPRTALRNGTRYVARLVAAQAPAGEMPIRADATYLVTGGFGALGVRAAQSLIARGARHLVLVSRRTNDDAIASLAKDGVEVIGVAVDVTDREEVERLFARLWSAEAMPPLSKAAALPPHSTRMPPLRGVIHAAGILRDALLHEQTPESLHAVLAPKAEGAWNLHRATTGMPLDFFILFASAASLLGSAGQSNYAAANAVLDALAHHRRSRGLPALSVDWGAFEEGMAADASVLRRFAARGVSTIEPDAAFDLLWRLAASADAQLGVIPIDWPKFLAQFPAGVPPLFARMAAGSEERRVLRDVLAAAPPQERGHLLFDHARETLFAVLGFDAATHVGAQQRFFDLGIDSLTAFELRNRLQATLGVSLAATVAFDHPTLDALSRHLASLLWPADADARDPQLAALSDEALTRLLAQELGDGR